MPHDAWAGRRLPPTLTPLDPTSTPPSLLLSGWYTTDDVADLLGVDPSTLRRWRTSTPPQGPPFVRLTARVTVYSAPDVEAWLASRRVDPAAAA
jgi:predicted DNA-binding transcriptional regulator AlpA